MMRGTPAWAGLSVYVMMAVVLMVGPGYGMPDGLVHHWNFDEGPDWHTEPFGTRASENIARDSAGDADAYMQFMASSARVSGVQYTALEFDGVNDHLYTSTNLAETLGGTCSLAYWLRVTGTSLPGIMGSDEIQWGAIDAAGKVVLKVDGNPAVTSAEAVHDGEWHYIVMTRNAATGAARIYVDGVLSATATGAPGVKSTAFNRIGRGEGSGNGSGYFAGRLDQIQVFNKVITPAMVTQLMDNHAPKTWEFTTQGTNTAAFTTASVFFNSYDVEGDSLAVVDFAQGSHGSVSYNGDGTFSYTANPGFTGFDAFAVVIEDGRGGFHRSNVKVSVLADTGAAGQKRTTTFTDFQAVQAGGGILTLNGRRVPRAIDWEGDNDYDLLIGHGGAIWRYMNTGGVNAPVFGSGVRVQAGGATISLSGNVQIGLADMTGDGVTDLVAVDNSRKIRVYRNTSSAGAVPVYAAGVIVRQPNNSDFVLPDPRFDVGDWDDDGLPDIIMGRWSGDMRAYRNVGTTSDPRYDGGTYESLTDGAYNLYPRLFDISRNGVNDLLQGINWGDITYWFDPYLNGGLTTSGTLVITDTNGDTVAMKPPTDGAIVDFADFNGDGVYDLLIGGHAGSNLFIAYGQARTVADCIAEIESIYDAHAGNLGGSLDANNQERLKVINANSRAIISHMQAASLPERQQMFNTMAAHVQKYAFLQMDSALNTSSYHHLPSIAGQNLMTMHQMLPDTPTHRLNVADAVGLTGLHREIYLASFLHVGDNQSASRGQLESIRAYMSHIPREIFPDALMTLDHYYGDGRGGTVNSFRGSKNTFNFGEGNDSGDGFHNDHDPVIEAVFGSGAYRGDYFTLVMGHEVTHSLDWYVRRCANEDLERRWYQSVAYAAGPDVIRGADGWVDWNATQAHFQSVGLWDGTGSWDAAWDAYWATGPGRAWESLSFMRGNIDWFLGARQESLATQANQHLSHSEGRLVAAIDRFRRGGQSGIEPMKANINECVTFLDFESAGLNKVVMYDTRGVQTPYPRADYTITYAWLERNDQGYITGIRIDDRAYDFVVDAAGIVVDVSTNILTVADDRQAAFHNVYNVIDVLANDNRLEGGKPALTGFTQAGHGEVSDHGDGTLRYVPTEGYYGPDSFTYTATGVNGGGEKTATVNITVAGREGILKERYTGIGGSSVSDLTGSTKFPDSPDQIEVVGSFQTPEWTGDQYGIRMSGWLKPPTTGTYTFWIASDDGSELWLSSDHEPGNAALICSVSGWVNYKQWDAQANQESASIGLTADERYYIAAMQKEGSGGDHLAVAWSGPGLVRQVIDGACINASYPEPPAFVTEPTVRGPGYEGRTFAGTVADAVVDGNGAIEFVKLEGPDWLSVGEDGFLTGITTDNDTGKNLFKLRVVNSGGAFADMNLEIEIYDLLTGELGLSDFAGLAAFWLNYGCDDRPECGGADLSGDSDVDQEDLALFFENWLQQEAGYSFNYTASN